MCKLRNESAIDGLIWQAIDLYPVDKLEQFVLDPDSRVREAAARRLQLHGGAAAFSLAFKLVESNDCVVRGVGVFILGQLDAPRNSFSGDSLPILLKMLKKEKSSKVRREVIISLGHLRDDSVLPELLRFLHSKDKNTRAALAASLSFFGNNSIAKKALKRLRKDKSSSVRYWAA